jgi:hypothetical protein
MKSCAVFLTLLLAIMVAATPAYAAKRHYTLEELQREADTILIGKVESYRTERQVIEGEERTRVILLVSVDLIEKGKPPADGKISIRCDRLTRPSPYGLPTHEGNASIPAPSSRARFYLIEGAAMSPNGIEVLDGGAELDLPLKASWWAFFEWPHVLLPLVVILTILVAVFWKASSRRKNRAA